MRQFRIMLLIIISLSISLAQGIDFEGLLESGNTHYKQGEFKQAIHDYEQIVAADGVSAVLEYNLGCAYFHEQEYGRAILHFEQAKQLKPRDVDIQHNLEYTRLFLKDRFDLPAPMPLVVWFTKVRGSLAVWELRELELTLFIILILLVIAWRFARNRSANRGLFIAVIIAGVLFILAAGWLWNRSLDLDDQHAVLLTDEANVSSAPVAGSSTLFVIHEGTTGEILDTTDSWYEIRLVDGKTGWISDEVVAVY